MRHGWSKEAAQAVVHLNAEWFSIQAEENPAGLQRQLALLRALGLYPYINEVLVSHPETAGLLAATDDPVLLADSIASSGDDYDVISGLFVQHAAPTDALALAQALKIHRDLICRLRKQGLLLCEVLFIFDRGNLASKEYDAWIEDVLTIKLAGSEDELASFANLLMRHGPGIRARLSRDTQFQTRFRADLWPKLARVAERNQNMYEQYLDDERIWDLLMLSDGERLLQDYGLLALDLLYGYPQIGHTAYPKHLHSRIIQVLLHGENRTLHALLKYRQEPLFHSLLARSLSTNTQTAALSQLFAADSNYPELLAKYDRLSDAALAEEVGPPPAGIVTWVPFYYTVYEVPKQLLQGRDPSGMDWFQAIMDPAFLVIDLTSGGGSKVVRETVTKGGLSVMEKGAEKAFVTTLRHAALELPTKQLGKELVEQLGEKELANWTVTATMSQMQHAVHNAIGKATTFEITKPMQFMFHYSNVGRATWKRLTGMEARLFMRGDAKVYVRLGNLAGAVVGSRTASFLKRATKDMTIGVVVESDPGQTVIRNGIREVSGAAGGLNEWRKHVSAWWLMNASHVPDNRAENN